MKSTHDSHRQMIEKYGSVTVNNFRFTLERGEVLSEPLRPSQIETFLGVPGYAFYHEDGTYSGPSVKDAGLVDLAPSAPAPQPTPETTVTVTGNTTTRSTGLLLGGDGRPVATTQTPTPEASTSDAPTVNPEDAPVSADAPSDPPAGGDDQGATSEGSTDETHTDEAATPEGEGTPATPETPIEPSGEGQSSEGQASDSQNGEGQAQDAPAPTPWTDIAWRPDAGATPIDAWTNDQLKHYLTLKGAPFSARANKTDLLTLARAAHEVV